MQSNDGNNFHNVPLESLHHSHKNNDRGIMILAMLVDGVGLAIIAGCTILEGYDMWKDEFNEYWDDNHLTIIYWISGRSFQLLGLMFLILHAA